ncbi:MAG: hypothetical protein M1540_08755 [Candidatus Bathyarchaeota archaeon]|nr:hypothetical protein [Candidatus Bathyarchaeota archaeon]
MKNNRLDRKSPFVFFLIVILVLALSLALYFQEPSSRPNQSEPNVPQVKITDFSVNDYWRPIGGLIVGYDFNLSIQNAGASNVSGLVLNITVTINDTSVPYSTYFKGTYENNTLIEPLAVGEVRACDGVLMTNLGSGTPFIVHSNGTSIKASVLLNGAVLDERES